MTDIILKFNETESYLSKEQVKEVCLFFLSTW